MAEEIENFFLHEAPNQNVEVKIFLLNVPLGDWSSVLNASLPKLVLRIVHPDKRTQNVFTEGTRNISRPMLAAISATHRKSRKWTFFQSQLPCLNFSPNENSSDSWNRHFAPLASVATIMLGTCAGIHQLLLDENAKLATQLEQLSHTQTQLASMETTLANRELELGSDREKLQNITRLETKRTVGNARLKLLSKAAPQGLWFRSLLLREGDFKIVGVAENHSILNVFIENLEKEKTIKQAVLENMAVKTRTLTQKTGNMSFRVRGRFQDIPGPSL